MFRLVGRARSEGGLVHQLVVIVALSTLSGVLLAGLALPWVGLISKGAENSAEAVQSFPKKLHFKPLDERTRVLASDGTRLATFYDENRKYVPLSKIHDRLQHAILAIEDARFYQHGALDVRGTLRALFINSASSAKIQGGSSITQQLVKMTLQEQAATEAEAKAATARSYARKLDELRYAVWVEEHLTKRQILEHYLNTAYFGDGAYGIEAASHHYFATTAAKLTLSQAALLAGMVKNPTGYDPTDFPKVARDRRNTVLAKMLELHLVTTKQAHTAMKRPLGLKLRTVANGCVNTEAPFFCDYLKEYLLASPALGSTREERSRRLFGGGLTITSTLDMRFQDAADQAVADHVYPQDQAIGGMAMVEPRTGYVRALSQSRPMGANKKKGQTYLNFVVPDRYGDSNGFQPGSTFKVFVLAQAIKMGIPLNTKIYAPPELRGDSQTDFKTCGNKPYPNAAPYKFRNSTKSGTHDLYSGTQLSVNTFFIKLELMTGLCGPWNLAKKMGVELENPGSFRVPSFPLGVSDVSPLEMAEAYATFPARGLHCPSVPVLEIRDRNGEMIPLPESKCNRVMKRAEADAVNDILRGVQEPGGFGYEAGIGLNQPSAGKTGTVAPAKSVWFIGYTPTLASASMIAGARRNGKPRNLDNQVIGGVNVGEVHGSSTAGPMWYDAMRIVQQWLPDRDFIPVDPTIVQGKTVPIPSFYGQEPQVAARQPSELGFNPQISYSVNSSAPYGTVAYTSPSTQGTSGEVVSIFISNGYTPPASPTFTPEPTYTPPPSPAPSPTPSPTTQTPTSPSPSPTSDNGNGNGNGGPGKPDKPR